MAGVNKSADLCSGHHSDRSEPPQVRRGKRKFTSDIYNIYFLKKYRIDNQPLVSPMGFPKLYHLGQKHLLRILYCNGYSASRITTSTIRVERNVSFARKKNIPHFPARPPLSIYHDDSFQFRRRRHPFVPFQALEQLCLFTQCEE